MSDKKFSKGDKVEWKSHGHNVKGEVEREITSDTEAAGRTVRASKDEPQYQVRSDKTDKDAVHKPSALRSETVSAERADLDDDDYAHMRKVVGYAKRHLAQRPTGDIADSAWRYSLMNWGHDPTKS